MASERIDNQLRMAKRLISTVQGQLERFQRSPGNMVLENEIKTNLSTLARHEQVLQRELTMLSPPDQAKCNSKVQIFCDELRLLQSDAARIQEERTQRRVQEQMQRELYSDSLRARKGLERMQMDDMQMNAMTHGSLLRSSGMADRIIDIGESVHSNLIAQNEHIEGIRGRVASILTTLGMSRSVMKTIDRKVKEEKWLVWLGMFIMVSIVIFWWWYFK